MVDDPLANDPAFAAWPADVRVAWAALRLPSLHDLVAAQERLAVEIRRQNQELRRLAQAATPDQGPAELLARLAQAQAEVLFTVAESAARHAQAVADEVTAILAVPPGRGWFGRALAWDATIRTRLLAQVAGARLVQAKARQALEDAGWTCIAPAPGDNFDPHLHRCVENASGPTGRVVARLRDGWRRGEHVARPAEVAVGIPETSA